MKNIRRPLALFAAALIGAGLALTGPTAASAATCTRAIEGWESADLSVGTTKTKTMTLAVITAEDCAASGATVTIKDPRGTRKITLVKESSAEGHVRWSNTYRVSPKTLTNSDAGTWPITFRVTGPTPDSLTTVARVRRAVRGTFNAGPEPVTGDRITYTGTIKRASWTSKKYLGISRDLQIYRMTTDSHESTVVSTPRSNKAGNYRVTQRPSGPGAYQMRYRGSKTTSNFSSPIDLVE